jgi:hypothetical protein
MIVGQPMISPMRGKLVRGTEHAGTWENLGLAEIQAMTVVTRSPGFKVL